MTQPQPLNYETPTEPRLADIDPRWLRSILIATSMLTLVYLVALNNWLALYRLPGSPYVISIALGALSLLAAILLTRRPPIKISFSKIRPAMIIIASASLCLSILLQWVYHAAIVTKSGTARSPSSLWWYWVVGQAWFLFAGAFRFLFFYYLSMILRLLPAPRLAQHALILAFLIPSLLIFQWPFAMRSAFFGNSTGLIYTVYSYSVLATTLWTLALFTATSIKLAQLLPRPS